jgi:hypothetical protein
MQKLARAVIGTNNMDNCSRYCQSPATLGLFRTVGYGGDSGSISDIEKAGLVLIVGSNTAESHNSLRLRLTQMEVGQLHDHSRVESSIEFVGGFGRRSRCRGRVRRPPHSGDSPGGRYEFLDGERLREHRSPINFGATSLNRERLSVPAQTG